MKRKIFFSALLIIAGLAACKKPVKGRNGVAYKNAVEYNDYIVNRQTTLMKKVLEFGKAAETSPDSANQLLDLYVTQTNGMITELKGMPPFNNDSTLRDAAIKSFTFYKRVFSDDYKRILSIRENADFSITDAETKMNAIVEKLSEEEDEYDKAFHNAQKNFALKNNMELRENSIQKELDKLDK